jgi:hypothetical protein
MTYPPGEYKVFEEVFLLVLMDAAPQFFPKCKCLESVGSCTNVVPRFALNLVFNLVEVLLSEFPVPVLS